MAGTSSVRTINVSTSTPMATAVPTICISMLIGEKIKAAKVPARMMPRHWFFSYRMELRV